MSDLVSLRGSKRLAEDNKNVMMWFVQDKDGHTVSGKRVKTMRNEARKVWKYLNRLGKLPEQWSSADSEVRGYYASEMRRLFPELQLCELDYKSHRIATIIYSAWSKKYVKPGIKMEDIKAEDADDTDDDDDEIKAATQDAESVGQKRSAPTPQIPSQYPRRANHRSPQTKPLQATHPDPNLILASTESSSALAPSASSSTLPLLASSPQSCVPPPTASLPLPPPTSSLPLPLPTALLPLSPPTALLPPPLVPQPPAPSAPASIPASLFAELPLPPSASVAPSPLDILARAAVRAHDATADTDGQDKQTTANTEEPQRMTGTPAVAVAGPAHLGNPSAPTTRMDFVAGSSKNTKSSATGYLRPTHTSTARNLCLKNYIENHGKVTKEVFDKYFTSLNPTELKVFTDASAQAKKSKVAAA
ncbi:hypothetical protein B0H12DRAFT_1134162 [Mycena haematopus]|nr:hypothetical protein B0H12DRAFT_1134162 [Mycena haematopus]